MTPATISLGGLCPVQAEGLAHDGRPWYFRARGNHWSFAVANTLCDEDALMDDNPAVGVLFGQSGWTVDASWGHGYSAGYMPLPEARRKIALCLRLYEAGRLPRVEV